MLYIISFQEYIDILEETNKTLANAEYFPEADSPPKGKSITKISSIKKNASGWLKSAADAWNKSFYWQTLFLIINIEIIKNDFNS